MKSSFTNPAPLNRIVRIVFPGIFLWFCLSESTLKAQNYTRDAGIRLGEGISATYRQYQPGEQALEEMLNMNWNTLTFTVMKEFFPSLFSHVSENLYFEYGFGAHAGFIYLNHYRMFNRIYWLDHYRFTPLVGVDGIVGVEYRFPEFPLVIGMDIRPYFEYSTVQIFAIKLQNLGISMKIKF